MCCNTVCLCSSTRTTAAAHIAYSFSQIDYIRLIDAAHAHAPTVCHVHMVLTAQPVHLLCAEPCVAKHASLFVSV
jgi:hypothetical protein